MLEKLSRVLQGVFRIKTGELALDPVSADQPNNLQGSLSQAIPNELEWQFKTAIHNADPLSPVYQSLLIEFQAAYSERIKPFFTALATALKDYTFVVVEDDHPTVAETYLGLKTLRPANQ